MKPKRAYLYIFLVIFFILDSNNIIFKDLPAQNNDVVVIINKTRGKLSKIQIKRIFTGRITRWPNGGGDIKILLNKDPKIAKRFCKKYLNLKPYELDDIWVKRSIRTGIPRPRKVNSVVITTMVTNSDVFIGVVLKAETNTSIKQL
ncbi:MAG: hypothetical protein SVZ03_05225 [Spirochaetota bacterium]|nr:hypothetical protein [Spirochaetota bacterium]